LFILRFPDGISKRAAAPGGCEADPLLVRKIRRFTPPLVIGRIGFLNKGRFSQDRLTKGFSSLRKGPYEAAMK
jgi:hypothetical protein